MCNLSTISHKYHLFVLSRISNLGFRQIWRIYLVSAELKVLSFNDFIIICECFPGGFIWKHVMLFCINIPFEICSWYIVYNRIDWIIQRNRPRKIIQPGIYTSRASFKMSHLIKNRTRISVKLFLFMASGDFQTYSWA